VYAGTAMLRRGVCHTGESLEPGPRGLIGTGLGQTASHGTVTLLPPTVDIAHTGQTETLDGVPIVFQSTPNTEAPSEMNFLFPDRRALCMAENATHNLHNILTLRGAVVRDARIWSRYLNEATTLFADDADLAFASHHWPTWGRERIVRFLSQQRDLYAYLHDQTLRLLNQGWTGIEIAETIQMPPALQQAWHTHGYYGSVSHNVKAIYQRHLGWLDGNPAHLWEHPPVEASKRYVDCIGGVEAVVAKARGYADAGDLRFAVELLNHAVFADPDQAAGAKSLLAEVYERLGFGDSSETVLGYRLRQHHVGVVCWVGEAEAGSGALARLEHATVELARRAECEERPMFLPQDESSAWAWLPLGARDTFAVRIMRAGMASGIRFALGTVRAGVSGFRRTHWQALGAYAVALAAGPSGQLLTSFKDFAPLALMSGSTERMRAWVIETLGSLADDDSHNARLRDTLRVFPQENGSFKATAERLTLHKNTVQYLVRKAEEGLGRPIAENRLHVELALLATQWLGASVLRDVADPRP
jgi:Alkyl sulfatase dimerisation/PucR C-terminal helix-turn-helix domain/GGDEF-like domain